MRAIPPLYYCMCPLYCLFLFWNFGFLPSDLYLLAVCVVNSNPLFDKFFVDASVSTSIESIITWAGVYTRLIADQNMLGFRLSEIERNKRESGQEYVREWEWVSERAENLQEETFNIYQCRNHDWPSSIFESVRELFSFRNNRRLWLYINFDWHIYYRITNENIPNLIWFQKMAKTKVTLIFIIPLRMVIPFVYRLWVCAIIPISKWQAKCPLVNDLRIFMFICRRRRSLRKPKQISVDLHQNVENENAGHFVCVFFHFSAFITYNVYINFNFILCRSFEIIISLHLFSLEAFVVSKKALHYNRHLFANWKISNIRDCCFFFLLSYFLEMKNKQTGNWFGAAWMWKVNSTQQTVVAYGRIRNTNWHRRHIV